MTINLILIFKSVWCFGSLVIYFQSCRVSFQLLPILLKIFTDQGYLISCLQSFIIQLILNHFSISMSLENATFSRDIEMEDGAEMG